jgi:hypothetical protein
MAVTIDGTSGITLSGSTNQLTFNDASTQISHAAPQITVYTSGSGTYTTPTNAKYLQIKMVGGGGGGGGGSNNGGSATAGTAGGNTTFGSSFLTCNGGGGGVAANDVATTGGTATIGAGASGIAMTGAWGGPGEVKGSGSYGYGGSGGSSPFGGGAPNATVDSTPNATGYGSGGAGGPCLYGGSQADGGSGGGAGGYIDCTIPSPVSSYSYAVGAAGSGGAGGFRGGTNGSSGVIFITAYF